jgi:tetratricopeptide (TPR) repeat protein
LESCLLLADLGYDLNSPEIIGARNAILNRQKDDGRIQTFSTGTIYPCQTANATKVLCRLGLYNDIRLSKTYDYFLKSSHNDGGWRCNASKYGKGPETLTSNPGPTLTILDVFRYTDLANTDKSLDKAVLFLLDHWDIKKPIGPCHYGIGTLFMKIEFPVFRYNLLNYCFVLSFYKKAKADKRFIEALSIIKSKLQEDNLVIENANRKLKDLVSCRVGSINEIATTYYDRIIENIGN